MQLLFSRAQRFWSWGMNNLRKHFFQNVASTFAISIISLFLSIVTSVVIARTLGPEKKGILDVALQAVFLLGLFLSGGINISNTYFAGSRQYDIRKLKENSVNAAIIATVIGAVIAGLLFSTGWVDRLLPGVPRWAVLLALVGFPAGILISYYSAILQGLERIIELNYVRLAQVGLTLLLTVLLTIVFRWNLLGALIASLIASFLGVVGFGALLRKGGEVSALRWDSGVMKNTLDFGLRGYVGNILQFFNYRLDVFLVNYFLGPAAVGIYGVSVAIAELLWQFPNAITFVLFPKASAARHENIKRFTLRLFWLTLATTVIGGFGLVLFGRILIKLLYTNVFISAYLPMLALLPGVVFLGGAKVLTAEILGRGYPQYNSILAGLGLVVTVIADLILIPRYGVIGAAVASSLSYLVVFLSSLCFYFFLVPKKHYSIV